MNATKQELHSLINIQNKSYEEIGKIYNVSGTYIKKYSKKIGIELPIRRIISLNETFNKGKDSSKHECKNCSTKSRNKDYCSRSCQAIYQTKEKYKYFLTNPEEYQTANYHPKWIKPIILLEQNNKCDICKCVNIHNSRELVFILDHINGDASNNRRDNLRLVCPNCDSQLDTYKSKNKNSARKERYLKQIKNT